ncbi:MAG: GNAT family N-acetyltransferase [Pseudomonas oryzihabitans]|jgi:ribosomal protein S18 acetylase RimI-like enzyme|uniref:Ribosomal protein S18 acetylase RimI-like enzyme n=1 Tax=Ectopseudomonas oleovorans TaxID=301 RepID=A0A3D9F2Z8_ECTOL|nr:MULTISPECIES: GNAT family N-acetyltransferase [Pseudomonas]MBH3329597.1 GNAT family N-acetyltransferase [Pseudomonas oryzihabitans]MDU4058411.1 GNAT family N-acetyltransferase [Pseudomonas oryzihabitans]RED09772.1 ribosomal protein S18 acetylase RimI-like enzyme [Pseudomonas oleovorans]
MPSIRPLRPADLPAVLAIQAANYPADLLEDHAFYANRLELAPEHCWAALDAEARLQGYLIAYPWDDGLPPVLGARLEQLPGAASTWFLHDCAVHPDAQGQGVAGRLYRHAKGQARRARLRQGRLVSLSNAIGYWQRHHYHPVPADAALEAKLAGYGAGACLMQRTLDTPDSNPA